MKTSFDSFNIDISPTSQIQLGGYANRKKKSSGFYSALEANCLLVKQDKEISLLIISIDALFPSVELKESLIKKLSDSHGLKLSDSSLAFVSSHTHYAPSLDPKKPILGSVDCEHFKSVVAKLAKEIYSHIKNSSPQSKQFARYSKSICTESIYRRKTDSPLSIRIKTSFPFLRKYSALPNKTHKINQELQLIYLYDDNDRVFCVLWSWPCHAVSSANPQSISSDFPGAIRSHLRETLENNDLSVLYFPGFCGDIRPNFTTKRVRLLERLVMPFYVGERFAKNDKHRFNKLCTCLKKSIETSYQETKRISVADFKVNTRTSIPLKKLINDFNGDYTSLPVFKFELGDVCFTLIGAEVCSDYYKLLKSDNKINFLSGYFDECFGYLPSDKQVPEGGYEVEGFMTPFGIKGNFKPHYQQQIIDAVKSR